MKGIYIFLGNLLMIVAVVIALFGGSDRKLSARREEH